MSNPTEQGSSQGSGMDAHSVLFAQLVMRQTNMAFMFLGKIAHPETGHTMKDLDAARLFIDELEMIEAKTRGNLNKDEAGLLKQSLMNLRLAYVQAVEEPENKPAESKVASAQSQAQAQPPQSPATAPGAAPGTPSASEEESRKKFSKKY